jgi:[protein-PII] uridylyltransferase
MCRQAEVRRQMVDLVTTDAPYAELGIVVDDRPGTLAAITAALSANRLRVVGAQLYSWIDRAGRKRVLDLFWVRSGNDPTQVKKYLERLEGDIEALMSGRVEWSDLAESRRTSRLSSRPLPDVETRISFDNRSASLHTVVEVVAQDRQGLLHHLSRALADEKLEIGLAKINTEGNAVADVFYVMNERGQKIVDEAELSALEEKLKAAVMRAELASSD